MLDNNLNMRKFRSVLLIFLLIGSIITIVVAVDIKDVKLDWTSTPTLTFFYEMPGRTTNSPASESYLVYPNPNGGWDYFQPHGLAKCLFSQEEESWFETSYRWASFGCPGKYFTDYDDTKDEWKLMGEITSVTSDNADFTCTSGAINSNIGDPTSGNSKKPTDNNAKIYCNQEVNTFSGNSFDITLNYNLCGWDDTQYAYQTNLASASGGLCDEATKTFTVLYSRGNQWPRIKDLSATSGGFDGVIDEGERLDIDWSDFEARYEDDDLDDMQEVKIKGSGSYGDLFFGVLESKSSWTTLTSPDFTAGVYYQADSNPSFGNEDVLTEIFSFQVFDGGSWSLIGEFKIKINKVEDAPVWTSTAINTATEDTQYKYVATASDPEGDALTLSALTCPSWLTCQVSSSDSHITISGTPTNDDVGDHNVVLSVSDDTGTTFQDFSIEVTNTNDAPETNTDQATINVRDGSYVSFDLDTYFTDKDEDDLTYYSVDPNNCWEASIPTLSPTKGSLNSNLNKYSAEDEKSGLDYFCIQADDENGGTKNLGFKVLISNTNDPPISKDDYVDIQEEETIQFRDTYFFFEDVDTRDSLSKIIVDPTSIKNGELRKGTSTAYDVISRGSSSHKHTITIFSNLNYVPNDDFSGEDSFKFKVSDGKEGGESPWYEMTIFVSNVNDIPTITTIPPETTKEDIPITINVIAEDIEDKLRDLTLTATSSDENLVKVLPEDIKSKSGLFEIEINPKKDQHGSAQITFTVTDSEGATNTETFQLTVEPVNDKPTSQDSEITIERSADIVFDQSYFPFLDIEDQFPTLIQITGVPEASAGELAIENRLISIGSEFTVDESNKLTFISRSTGTETIDYILRDSNGESTESHSITINIEESRFGANSQLCEQGGLRILNSNYCCKGGFIPKPDLFDISLTSGDIDACQSYENQPPKARITVPDTNITVNDTITFDGSTSRDPDGIIVNYLWNFGDGSEDLTGEIVTHKMKSDCTVTACDITLTVTDNFDNTDETSIQLILAELNETNESTITIIPEEEPEEEPEQLSTPEPEPEEEPEEEEPDYGAYDYGFDKEPPEKGSSMAWVILILIAALIGGAIFLWKKGGTTKKEPEQDFTSSISEPEQVRPLSDDKKEHMDKFISEQKGQGQSNEEIRQKLLGKGWNDEEVDKHMNESRE